jgi:hypothetical protein
MATYIKEGGGGNIGAILVGIAVLIVAVIAGIWFLNSSHNDAVRTDAVTGAASSVAQSAERAADSASSAAQQATR